MTTPQLPQTFPNRARVEDANRRLARAARVEAAYLRALSLGVAHPRRSTPSSTAADAKRIA